MDVPRFQQNFSFIWNVLLTNLESDVERPDFEPAQTVKGEECIICLREYNDTTEDKSRPSCKPIRLACSHMLGLECFREHWQRTTDTLCPFCRQQIPTIDVPCPVPKWLRFLYKSPIFRYNLKAISAPEDHQLIELEPNLEALWLATNAAIGLYFEVFIFITCTLIDANRTLNSHPSLDGPWTPTSSRQVGIDFLIAAMGIFTSSHVLVHRFWAGRSLVSRDSSVWSLLWIMGRFYWIYFQQTLEQKHEIDVVAAPFMYLMAANAIAMSVITALSLWAFKARRRMAWRRSR